VTATAARPRELARLVSLSQDFVSPRGTVEALDADLALAQPAGWPHSIAQVLAHVVFWQERAIKAAVTGQATGTRHAAEGWPPVTREEWPHLTRRFLTACADIEGLAGTADLEHVTAGGHSIGHLLASNAQHTAHHMGQIVLMRRLLGAWPPGGGMDW